MHTRQLEFPFAGPPILSDDERFVGFLNNMLELFEKISPNWRDGIKEVLEACNDVQPMINDGPYLPVTIVCGYRNQPEFFFVRPLDEATWKGFPVEYHCELDRTPISV